MKIFDYYKTCFLTVSECAGSITAFDVPVLPSFHLCEYCIDTVVTKCPNFHIICILSALTFSCHMVQEVIFPVQFVTLGR